MRFFLAVVSCSVLLTEALFLTRSSNAQIASSPLTYTESGTNVTLRIAAFGTVGQTATLYASLNALNNTNAVATTVIQSDGSAIFTIAQPQNLTYFRANNGTLWSSNAPQYNLNSWDFAIQDNLSTAPPLIYMKAPSALPTLPNLSGKKVKVIFYGDSNGIAGFDTLSDALSNAGAEVSLRTLNHGGANSGHLIASADPATSGGFSPYYTGLNNFQGLQQAISEVPSDTIPIVSLSSFGANNAFAEFQLVNWRSEMRQLCQDLHSLNVPVVAQFHAAYLWAPTLDTIRTQTIESTQIARSEGLWTPTDAEALDMMASFYRATPDLYPPSTSDGIHYSANPTHARYHGEELAPIFARAINGGISSIPDPSTLTLLAFGGALLLRRSPKPKVQILSH
jgi:hypothetical protein